MKSMRLILNTSPAMELAADGGMRRFRKELIRTGSYIKASTGQTFSVTTELIDGWVSTFREWVANGLKMPLPLGHDNAGKPEKNAGWLLSMWREGESLFGALDLVDEKLALTTDVSICVEPKFTDGHGHTYTNPITHVALCTNPVIPGLGAFETLSLSLDIRSTEMDVKTLAKLLGMAEDVSEELVLAEVTKLKTTPAVKDEAVISASQAKAVDPVIVQLMGENRQAKVSTLLSAGLITPAVNDIIAARYVEKQALTLSLSWGGDDGFDTLFEVLTKNKPVAIGEASGPQLLALANTKANGAINPVAADVNRRRELAGMDK